MRERVDATLLKRKSSLHEVMEFTKKVDEAGFRALVTFPFFYNYMHGMELRVKKVGVVDFPYGTSPIEVKVKEAELCKELGLDEIDYVVNLAAFKSVPGYVREEALRLASTFPGVIKAIVEVPLLSDDELSRLVDELRGTGITFLKTSTGLYRPVTKDDVRKLRELSRGEFLVKAAGGIRSKEMAMELVNAGADVLGTSTPFSIS